MQTSTNNAAHLQHFIIIWAMTEQDRHLDYVFKADVYATDKHAAMDQFEADYPDDILVGCLPG